MLLLIAEAINDIIGSQKVYAKLNFLFKTIKKIVKTFMHILAKFPVL